MPKRSPTPDEYDSRTADKFVLRFKPGVRDRVAAKASRNGRSMNSEIHLAILKDLGDESPTRGTVSATELELLQATTRALAQREAMVARIVRTMPDPGPDQSIELLSWISRLRAAFQDY